MGRRTVARFAHRIKRVLSPTVLNDLGRRVGFCHRERLITPYRLVLGLLAGHATGTVETLADMQRQFNALFGTTVAYKPFHNQLAKRSFKFGEAFGGKSGRTTERTSGESARGPARPSRFALSGIRFHADSSQLAASGATRRRSRHRRKGIRPDTSAPVTSNAPRWRWYTRRP